MPKTYHKQTAAFLGKVGECMPEIPASVMQGWIQNPALLQNKLSDLQLWLPSDVIDLLTPNIIACEKLLKNPENIFTHSGVKISQHMLANLTYDSKKGVLVSPATLGFTESPLYPALYKRACDFGFVACPYGFVIVHQLKENSKTFKTKPPSIGFGCEPVLVDDPSMLIYSHGEKISVHSIVGVHCGDIHQKWLFALKE